jgi:hypothetical protein
MVLVSTDEAVEIAAAAEVAMMEARDRADRFR